MRRLAATLPLVAALLTGCFAVNAPSDHVAAPVSADAFCERFGALICEPARLCCGDREFELADCIMQVGAFCASVYAPLTSDPRTGYDAAEAGVQLNIGRALAEDCDPAFFAWLSGSDNLFSMLQGTVPPDGSCNPLRPETEMMIDLPRFLSCTGSHVCAPADEGWTCQPRPGEGEPCGFDFCEAGLTCIGRVCVRPREAGAPCGSTSHCASGVCLGETDTTPGECADGAAGFCALLVD